MATSPDKLRLLRAVPDPIPWYLRVGYNDHRLVENKLSAGDTRINRFVDDVRLTLESLTVETDVNVRRSSIPRRAPFRPMPAVKRNNQRPTL